MNGDRTLPHQREIFPGEHDRIVHLLADGHPMHAKPSRCCATACPASWMATRRSSFSPSITRNCVFLETIAPSLPSALRALFAHALERQSGEREPTSFCPKRAQPGR